MTKKTQETPKTEKTEKTEKPAPLPQEGGTYHIDDKGALQSDTPPPEEQAPAKETK